MNPNENPDDDRSALPERPLTERVAAIVTTFHPGRALVPLVRSLVEQAGFVVVVDDGSGPSADAVLDAAHEAGAEIIRHERNRGIAAALDTGLAVAWVGPDDAPDFFVTFDQDSSIDERFIETLVGTAIAADAAGIPVGLVAPAHVEGLPSVATGSVRGFPVTRTPIQSGLLIPVATVRDIGDFTEELVIDGVDTDYGLRVARAGRQTVLSNEATLGHRLGTPFTPKIAGRPVSIAGEPLRLVVGAPFRYYYLLRNRILLNRMHGPRNRRWMLRATLADLRHCVIVLAFAPRRLARLTAMAVGVRDGWRGRGGRIPERLERRLG
ncbi:glycosyltransferase [Herbiconiux solani]|uniref:glycosyltransferase n=1 Tax=Herbiconiux solani TaxID=661329 RepID=UPI000826C6E1|nr:glycosyltransferase [Herbiconiux solani]